MAEVGGATGDVAHEYVVVLRAPSSARFVPEGGWDGDPTSNCTPNTIHGGLTAANNTGGGTITGNTITGTWTITNNTPRFTVAGNHH